MAEGKRPLSVGFWFSLGHSTIVFALAFLFAIGVRALERPGARTTARRCTASRAWIGTSVSGTFLYLIAALNLVILVGIVRVFREMRTRRVRRGRSSSGSSTARGLMNRFLGRVHRGGHASRGRCTRSACCSASASTPPPRSRCWSWPAARRGAGLPFYAILCLPILFAAGMSLLDTIDGSFMNFAYGWAFSKPVRKVYYNITITGLSVAVALVIGTIELAGLFAQKLGAHGPVWEWFENIDLNALGFVIVGMFVVTWAIALSVWRFGRIEERWTARARESDPVAAS